MLQIAYRNTGTMSDLSPDYRVEVVIEGMVISFACSSEQQQLALTAALNECAFVERAL